jgi:HEAT repeat protein
MHKGVARARSAPRDTVNRSRALRDGTGKASGWWVCVALLSAACATVPPLPEPPVVTWEDKLGWMMRLEDQRLVRDPNPPPPVVLAPATSDRPAIVAPPPPSDLIRLLNDSEARVRRRAAMALGRVGLPEAVDPLAMRLNDEEPDVRLMAAFALGQIGDAAARPALLAALADPDPRVQGRAAEALGMIASGEDAAAVSDMVQGHVRAGALAGLQADDLTYPLAPPVEAVRLGLFALVRLGSYEALAGAALDASGQPVSRWWPVSYALQRLGDPRASDALIDLLRTPGRFTAAFAARGLGVMRAQAAAPTLRQAVEQPGTPPAVVVQAIRALAGIGDAAAVPLLTDIVVDGEAGTTLRIEAMTALGGLASQESLDLMLDLLADPAPPIRGTAMRALARIDPLTFLGALSGLDPDRDWTVRTAQASALGVLPPEQGLARLTIMLDDPDPRVVPAVLAALVASKAPEAEGLLVDRLEADDFAIRSAAAAGLAGLMATAAVPSLIEAYRAGIGDSTYDARAAALVAMAQIDPQASRPILEEALTDREWAVRVRVAQLLRDLGADETVAAAIRPATSGRPMDEVSGRGC